MGLRHRMGLGDTTSRRKNRTTTTHTAYDYYWAQTRRNSPSNDGISGVLLLQAGICAAALLICVGVRSSGGTMFAEAQSVYSEMISHQSGWEEVQAVFAGLGDRVEETKDAIDALFSGEPIPVGTTEDNMPLDGDVPGATDPAVDQEVSDEQTPTTDEDARDLYGVSTLLSLPHVTGWISPTALQAIPGGLDGGTGGPVVTTGSLVASPIPNLSSPISGWISSEFGYRTHPITDKLDYHTGVDIAAAQGEDILAAAAGTVVETGESNSLGLYVILQHGNAVQTVYGHCSKILTREGARVKAGTRIALVGSTGVSTGPHLHFEIRIGGSPVDPIEYVLIPEN